MSLCKCGHDITRHEHGGGTLNPECFDCLCEYPDIRERQCACIGCDRCDYRFTPCCQRDTKDGTLCVPCQKGQ